MCLCRGNNALHILSTTSYVLLNTLSCKSLSRTCFTSILEDDHRVNTTGGAMEMARQITKDCQGNARSWTWNHEHARPKFYWRIIEHLCVLSSKCNQCNTCDITSWIAIASCLESRDFAFSFDFSITSSNNNIYIKRKWWARSKVATVASLERHHACLLWSIEASSARVNTRYFHFNFSRTETLFRQGSTNSMTWSTGEP